MAVLASFLGAFLLFALQPLVGKSLLPLYGGGAGPWIACMLFFQLVLLGGYAYAHGLARSLGGPKALRIHGALALASLGVLALGIRSGGAPWIPAPGSAAGSLYPPLAILLTLSASAGLPLLLLASTSPLIQAAFASLHPGRDPYRLYAVSNAGSLGGLLCYPFLLEPLVDLRVQAWGAALLFLVYLALLFALLRRVEPVAPAEGGASAAAPGGLRRWAWIGLSALGTVWLCAVTNRISTDVASMPLLWIPPLAAYLLTFILVFETRWSFEGPAWRVGLGALVLVMAWILGGSLLFTALLRSWGPAAVTPFNALLDQLLWLKRHMPVAVALTVLAGAAGSLLAHARLAGLRPEASRLTEYYLCVSVGGALGGLFVSVGGPLLFDQDHELSLAVAATGVLLVLVSRGGKSRLKWPALGLGAASAALGLLTILMNATDRTRYHARDFFGTLLVEFIHPKVLALAHGSTIHGIQFVKEPLRPASYYGADSGIGVVLRTLNAERGPMRVGLVGLGVGNTAAFGRPGDEYLFFEISPRIIEVAGIQGTFFSVLKSSPATVRVLQGDGRILAAAEARTRGGYDVLLIDAFAGGHIPAHLLTVEALREYAAALKPGGLLVLHVSHDMPLPVQAGANLRAAGLPALLLAHDAVLGKDRAGTTVQVENTSIYWIAGRDAKDVFRPEFMARARRTVLPPPEAGPRMADMGLLFSQESEGVRPWTDQRHALSTLLLHGWRHRRP
ncbi:MAG: hypothetical protein U0P81_04520 [Holophagaceae bacterium]